MNALKLALKEFIMQSGQSLVYIVNDNNNIFEQYFDSIKAISQSRT